MPKPSVPVDTRGHSCECDCEFCEINHTGRFGQLAALDGDRAAAGNFAPGVIGFLAEQAAERKQRVAA
jgi:hypothetical protein